MHEVANEGEHLPTVAPTVRRNSVILPNKDIWHGCDSGVDTSQQDNIAIPKKSDNEVTPEDQEKAIVASHSCPWCGEVSKTDDQAREHIQTFHSSALKSSAQQEREALEASHGRGLAQGLIPAGPVEGE